VYPVAAQIFWVPLIISGTGKATDFKFCRNIHRSIGTRKPMKNFGNVAVGVVRESRKFSGHPRTGRIAQSSLGYHSFYTKVLTDFTYRNLHGFVRFPGDSTALVIKITRVTDGQTYRQTDRRNCVKSAPHTATNRGFDPLTISSVVC